MREGSRGAPRLPPSPSRSPPKIGSPVDFLRTFARHRAGATAIEYGLMAALIAVALIAVMKTTSGAINTKFNSLSSVINASS